MDAFKKAFDRKMHLLSENLTVSSPLLNRLRDSSLITSQQRNALDVIADPYDRAFKLLDMLMKQPNSKFDTFCTILEDDNQPGVVEMIRPNQQPTRTEPRNPGPNNPRDIPGMHTTTEIPQRNAALRAAFQELYEETASTVNVTPIVGKLFAKGVLNFEDTKQLSENPRRDESCRRLLLLLHQSARPDAFIHLRQAISEDSAYDFLVQAIDEKCDQHN